VDPRSVLDGFGELKTSPTGIRTPDCPAISIQHTNHTLCRTSRYKYKPSGCLAVVVQMMVVTWIFTPSHVLVRTDTSMERPPPPSGSSNFVQVDANFSIHLNLTSKVQNKPTTLHDVKTQNTTLHECIRTSSCEFTAFLYFAISKYGSENWKESIG